MKISVVFLFFIICVKSTGVYGGIGTNYITTVERDALMNDFLSEDERIQKIKSIINSYKNTEISNKFLFDKYAETSLLICMDSESGNEKALNNLIWIMERCDKKDKDEMQLFLSATLQTSFLLNSQQAYELSLKYCYQGIDLIKKNKIEDYYNCAGINYIAQVNYKDGNKALLQALEYVEPTDFYFKSALEHNIAQSYSGMKNFKKALEHEEKACQHYLKAQDLDKNSKPPSFYALLVSGKSRFAYESGKFDEAKKNALEAEKFFEINGWVDFGAEDCLQTLVKIAIREKDAARIKQNMDRLESAANILKANKKKYYKILNETYHILGDKNKELTFLKLEYSEYKKENEKTIKTLQKFNSNLQKHKINTLISKQRLEANTYRLKMTFTILIIVFISLTCLIVVYILFTKAKNRQKLLEQQKILTEIERNNDAMKAKLIESELNEKRLISARLASHVKLKHLIEVTFLKKIKELKRSSPEKAESIISELQINMMNLIQMDQNLEQVNQVEDIHIQFKQALKKIHPNLIDNELQFCVYLLLNLSSKEISAITNQTVGAVRVYKNNIKNKVNLHPKDDLLSYLNEITKSNEKP